jgi:hypothetical protein
LDSGIFDLQKFISDQHQETRADLLNLAADIKGRFDKIDNRTETITANLLAHERADLDSYTKINLRLHSIEGLVGNFKWFTRVTIVALLTLIVDVIVHHLK